MPDGDLKRLIDQFRQELLRQDRAAASRMVRAYGTAWQSIQDEISRLHTEYNRSGGQDTSAAWFAQYNRLSSLRLQVEAQLLRFTRQMEGEILNGQREAIRSALMHSEQLTGAALGPSPPGAPEVGAIFNQLPIAAFENLIGILQDGSPLRDLLNALPGEGAQIVTDGLIQGLALGMGAREIARNIREGLGGNLARALRIARMEILRPYREATHQSYRANSDIVEKWIWRSARNERTCAMCWAMDGTEHDLEDQIDDHIAGRCFAVPKTKTWAELGFSGIEEAKFRQDTGIEAFGKLPEATKYKILGPAKYAAMRDGRIKLDDLIGRRYDPRWGWMRYEKSLRELGIDWRDYIGIRSKAPTSQEDLAKWEDLGRRLSNPLSQVIGTIQRWSGKINLIDPARAPDYMGAKEWNCDIVLRTDVRSNTLIHEMIHGHSVGLTPEAYIRNRGWEEGIVEKLQRMLGANALASIGETPITGTYAYNGYVSALEKLRRWSKKSEEEFYLELIRINLAERPNKVLQWLQDAGKSEHGAKALITKVKKYLL